MTKISILIPVYNVEKYLKECLESVINQTLNDIEIICLNDGSTDLSPNILEEYAKRDSRIRVIHKNNTGYGDTMNIGLFEAKGEYIGIVESDDFIEADMYQELYQIAKENNLDFVKSNYWEYTNSNRKMQTGLNNCICNEVFSQHENMNKFTTPRSIWSAIYKRTFLLDNSISFLPTPGASYQDTSFWFKVYITAKRGYFTPKAYLNYRCDNINSSVKSKTKVFCVCDELKECRDYFLRLREEDIKIFYPYYLLVKSNIYVWNIGRLSLEPKKEFMFKMMEELKNDINTPFLEKNTETYRKYKYIIDNSQEYIEYNSKNVNLFSVILNDIYNYISAFSYIYIYGAGKKGNALMKLFHRVNVNAKVQFIITDTSEKTYYAKNIYAEELDTNCPIMIAIADHIENFKAYQKAKTRGFNNIILVDLTISELENI